MAIKRFIFDTNTLVSAFLLGGSTSSQAFGKALELGEIITTHTIKKELGDVFLRNKFDKYVSVESRMQVLDMLDHLLKEWPEPEEKIEVCRDQKDNKFLELALLSNADCIVTGDQDLLILHPFKNTAILNSRDFLTHF